MEFGYFKTKSGEQIISSDFVVGKDSYAARKITSGSRPRTNQDIFLKSLDQYGKNFFENLLDFAEKIKANGLNE